MWLLFLSLSSLSTVANTVYCRDDEVCLWFSRCHDKEQFTAVREKQELDDLCMESYKINESISDVAVKMKPKSPQAWQFSVFVRDFDQTSLEFGENRLEFVNGSFALFHLLNDTIEINVPMEAHKRVKSAASANFTMTLNQKLMPIFDGSVVRYTKINEAVAKYNEQELCERMKDLLWDQSHPPTSIASDVKMTGNKYGIFYIIVGILLLFIILVIIYCAYILMNSSVYMKDHPSLQSVQICEVNENFEQRDRIYSCYPHKRFCKCLQES